MLRPILAAVVTLCFSFHLFGATSKKAYIDDFEELTKLLEEIHPNPYKNFQDRHTFISEANKIRDEISNIPVEITDQIFQEKAMTFLSRLNDGHTWLSLPENTNRNESSKVLPIKILIAEDGLFIKEVVSSENKQNVGLKILKVEGLSLNADFGKLVKAHYQVENIYGLYSKIRKVLLSQNLINKLFGKSLEGIKLSLEDSKGSPRDVFFKYVENPDFIKTQNSESFLEFKYLDKFKKIGILNFDYIFSKEAFELAQKEGLSKEQIRNFGSWFFQNALNKDIPVELSDIIAQAPSLTEKMNQVLNSLKINKSKYLILDLRKNSGGVTPIIFPMLYMIYGDHYLNYSFPYQVKTKISNLYLKKFNKTLEQFNTENKSNYKIGDFQIEETPKMDLKEKRQKLLTENQDTSAFKFISNLDGKPIYTPQLIILTSENTFSAAFHLTYFTWHLGAKVVGIPPSQAGNTFMEVTEFKLKNSQLPGSISNSEQIFFPKDPEMGEVFKPFYSLKGEDFLKYGMSEDSSIKVVLDLISKGKL